jgi:hypothetical protein
VVAPTVRKMEGVVVLGEEMEEVVVLSPSSSPYSMRSDQKRHMWTIGISTVPTDDSKLAAPINKY